MSRPWSDAQKAALAYVVATGSITARQLATERGVNVAVATHTLSALQRRGLVSHSPTSERWTPTPRAFKVDGGEDGRYAVA